MPPDREKSIRDQLEKIGRPLPEIIANKPVLQGDELLLWKIFWELDTERPSSQAHVMQIPITKYHEYIKFYEIPSYYIARVLYCVRHMDIHHVTIANDKLEAMRAEARARKGAK